MLCRPRRPSRPRRPRGSPAFAAGDGRARATAGHDRSPGAAKRTGSWNRGDVSLTREPESRHSGRAAAADFASAVCRAAA